MNKDQKGQGVQSKKTGQETKNKPEGTENKDSGTRTKKGSPASEIKKEPSGRTAPSDKANLAEDGDYLTFGPSVFADEELVYAAKDEDNILEEDNEKNTEEEDWENHLEY